MATRMARSIHLGIVAVFLIATALTPWRATPAEEATQPGGEDDAQMVAKGEALYVKHCSRCHGFDMVSPGTVAYDLRRFPHDAESRFVQSVTNGKNGRMPAWGDMLSRDDIEHLWAFVKTGGRK
jgi:cytochrome c55X